MLRQRKQNKTKQKQTKIQTKKQMVQALVELTLTAYTAGENMVCSKTTLITK